MATIRFDTEAWRKLSWSMRKMLSTLATVGPIEYTSPHRLRTAEALEKRGYVQQEEGLTAPGRFALTAEGRALVEAERKAQAAANKVMGALREGALEREAAAEPTAQRAFEGEHGSLDLVPEVSDRCPECGEPGKQGSHTRKGDVAYECTGAECWARWGRTAARRGAAAMSYHHSSEEVKQHLRRAARVIKHVDIRSFDITPEGFALNGVERKAPAPDAAFGDLREAHARLWRLVDGFVRHGQVRLTPAEAEWFYSGQPEGTKEAVAALEAAEGE